MKKTIPLFILTLCSQLVSGQEASIKSAPYILDSINILQTSIFIDALKEKSLGNSLEAMKLFNQVLDANPNNDAALYEISKIESELSNFSGALTKAQKAYELDKKNKFYPS